MESEPSNEGIPVDNSIEAPEGMPAEIPTEATVTSTKELMTIPSISKSAKIAADSDIPSLKGVSTPDVTSAPTSEALEGLVDVKLTALGVVGSVFQEVRSSAKAVDSALASTSSPPTTNSGLTLRVAPVSDTSSVNTVPAVPASPINLVGEQTTNPMVTVSRSTPAPPLRRTFSGRLRHCFQLWGRK